MWWSGANGCMLDSDTLIISKACDIKSHTENAD